MPKIFMVEPEWWFDFLLAIAELWEKYPWVGNFYPIGADIFVFVYPVFLTALYLYGMVKKNRESKKVALFIFFACFFSVVVNILSQQFFDKQRPIHELGIVDVDQETLLHHLLPLTSFPSDHAVVTFSIAMATWLLINIAKCISKFGHSFCLCLRFSRGFAELGRRCIGLRIFLHERLWGFWYQWFWWFLSFIKELKAEFWFRLFVLKSESWESLRKSKHS